MKRLILSALFALFWISPSLAAGHQYALGVDGLACPFCAYGIEKRLSAIEGVEKVEIDIAKGRAVVTLREGATLSEAAARQAVKEAGFTLGSFARLPEEP